MTSGSSCVRSSRPLGLDYVSAPMLAEHITHRVGDFAQRAAGLDRIKYERHQVARAGGRLRQPRQRRLGAR